MNIPALIGFSLAVTIAAPAFAQQDAEAVFRQAFGEACFFDDDRAAAEYFPDESWVLTWQEEYSDTPSSATLYQFFCFAGAYNVNLVYLIDTEYDGLLPVGFAAPQYDVTYVDDDYEGEVESIKVRGFTSQSMLTNSEFDPDTLTMKNHALWRGIGDASSSGRWVFDKGSFVLKSYDVDATYDGEINPTRIVEYK